MSKIDSGKMQVESEVFSLTKLMSIVSEQISPLTESKGLILRADIDADVPEWVMGDITRLTQCLLNYAGNAVKFTRVGTIRIRASIAHRDESGILLRFEVADTGIGIEPGALARMFTPFEQADKSTTRHFGGTGLGLALTRQLAGLMGGEVGVDSTPGIGSTFWFTAMVRPASEQAIANHTDTVVDPIHISERYSGARLLVAEDVAMNRDVLKDILDEFGLKADFAENGEAALTMARTAIYDLILMDMQMPVMDGISATRAIRRLADYSETPIIALTANAFNEDREQCLAAGMNGFLSKPLRAHLLRAVLAEWLEKRPRIGQATPGQLAGAAITHPTPISDFERLRACLDGIEDIDLTQAPSAQSKPARYIAYLTEYADSFGNSMADLRDHLQADDKQAALKLVQSLHAASGQIGVMGIARLAGEFEDTLKEGASKDCLMRWCGDMETRLAIIIAAVRELRQ